MSRKIPFPSLTPANLKPNLFALNNEISNRLFDVKNKKLIVFGFSFAWDIFSLVERACDASLSYCGVHVNTVYRPQLTMLGQSKQEALCRLRLESALILLIFARHKETN